MKQLDGKVALITGASGGIGKAIAYLFAAEGADLILTDTKKPENKMTSENRVIYEEADVSNQASVSSLVGKTVEQMGRIDILVNTAGIGDECPFTEMSLDRWNKMINTNLTSVFMVTQNVVPYMIK